MKEKSLKMNKKKHPFGPQWTAKLRGIMKKSHTLSTWRISYLPALLFTQTNQILLHNNKKICDFTYCMEMNPGNNSAFFLTDACKHLFPVARHVALDDPKSLESCNLFLHLKGRDINSSKHLSYAITCSSTAPLVEFLPEFAPVVIYVVSSLRGHVLGVGCQNLIKT